VDKNKINFFEIDREATRLDLTRHEVLLAIAFGECEEDDFSALTNIMINKTATNATILGMVDPLFPKW